MYYLVIVLTCGHQITSDKTNIGPNVRLYMWIEGSDSAGWSIDGGGITDNGVQALEPRQMGQIQQDLRIVWNLTKPHLE